MLLTRTITLSFILLLLTACGEKELAVQTGSARLEKVVTEVGFSFVTPAREESSFLQMVGQSKLSRTTLMKAEDRLASAFWMESTSPEEVMNALTQKAFHAFSSSMENLVDDTLVMDGYEEMDVLAFSDPVLSSERIMIVQIGNTLYEFHYPPAQEPIIQGLLLKLAER